MKKLNVILLSMVIALSAVIVLMNYYTIRLLSATRAYINGESQYSKGQKEASGHLITYIYTQNEADYKAFETNINIPGGDRIAREALLTGNEHQLARQGFLQGKNNADDIDEMIWLFERFQHIGPFSKAISIWTEGDSLTNKLRTMGIDAHSQGKLSLSERAVLITSVNDMTSKLTVKEAAFSDTLGQVCRKVNTWVFMADVIIMLIIVISAVLYTARVIRNIEYSRGKIVLQNEHLTAVNNELDQLIYSVTHDLRSPLVAMSGLLELIDMQEDMESVKEFTAMMRTSIDRQNAFIQTVLRSAERQHQDTAEKCNLEVILDEVIAQNKTMLRGKEIEFIKELTVTDVFCDEVKLKTVLNNLISNAVKYADIEKDSSFVKVRSLINSSQFVIEVEDNGIGINQQNSAHIFEKYFVAEKRDNSMGIGLYLVKNMVAQMKGEIFIVSKPGKGSTFILKLPNAN